MPRLVGEAAHAAGDLDAELAHVDHALGFIVIRQRFV
jgi:hypothetical protein